MTKKIFTLAFAILFLLTNFSLAQAKKKKEIEISPEDRVKISVEVEDKTSFKELDTAEILHGIIQEQLSDKKIFNVISDEEITKKYSEMKSLGEKQSSSDVGELLYFNPVEISYGAGTDADLAKENYKCDYLLKCQILALGTTAKASDVFGAYPGFGIGVGSHHRFGFGIYSPIGISTKQMLYCAAINVQFIKVDTNVVLWQRNLVGQAIRHKKPSKGYDDRNDEAYLKSLHNASKIILERVERYSESFLIPKPETEEAEKKKK